jgi:hypothetical protein
MIDLDDGFGVIFSSIESKFKFKTGFVNFKRNEISVIPSLLESVMRHAGERR